MSRTPDRERKRVSVTPGRDASEPERPHRGRACESLTFTTIQVDRRAAIWHYYYAI
jgi:hypothetical protein